MSASSWTDCCPEQGDEAYSERSTERRQVFEDAASRLDTGVSPSIWAFLQVADLEQVKKFTHSEIAWNTVKEGEGEVRPSWAKDALRLWKQRPEEKETDDTAPAPKRTHSRAFSNSASSPHQPPRSQISASESRTRSGRPLGAPEGSVRRDARIAKRSKERDGNLCVISGMGAAQACHIYPWCAFGAQNPDRVANFWKTLKLFWPKDKVDAWHAKIFLNNGTPYGTETVENMITFTATLHNFHSEGAFALRPVRITTDKTQLELEFHWLKRQVRDSSKTVDLLDLPMSSRDLFDSGIGQHLCYMDDNRVPTRLFSGQKFTMKTDDPVNKPLPDPSLLELQWHLQRIMAMSGAAGWKEDDFDNDDDSDPADGLVPQWIEDTFESRQSWSPSQDGSVNNGDGAYD